MLTTTTRRSNSPEPSARSIGGRRGASAVASAVPAAGAWPSRFARTFARNSALPAALLAATTMLLPACGDDDDDPTLPGCTDDFCAPYVQPTTPENALRNLKLAYESRDFDMFELGFAPEYIFEFSPEDVGQGNTPNNWPLADELESARNLFADETVDRIQFGSFVIPSSRPAVGSDSLPSIEGIQVSKVDEVRLSFFLRNEEGEVLELLVPGELCAFFFRQDSVDGEQRWRLVRWRDKPRIGVARAGPATLERSWGSMKNLFH